MDGQTVLWYVRARYTTSDFDRGRRQQEVLDAIGKQLLSLNALTRAPELYDIYRQMSPQIYLSMMYFITTLGRNLSTHPAFTASRLDHNRSTIGRITAGRWCLYPSAKQYWP